MCTAARTSFPTCPGSDAGPGRRDGGAYLLLTFGLAVVLSEVIRLIWGVQPLGTGIPDFLRGVVIILDQPFQLYRLFLIGLGVAAAIAIWQFLERARPGLLIRAVSQRRRFAK